MTTPTLTEPTLRKSKVLAAQALLQVKKHLPALVLAVDSSTTYNIIQTFPKAIRMLGFYRRNFPTIRANQLTDLVVSDNLERPNRFSVKYLIHSPRFHTRYILSFVTSEYRAIPSRRTPFKNGKAIFASAC